MDETALKLAHQVAVRYGKSLSQFRPCKPGSEVLEQNLITLLSHEFMVMFNDDERCVAYSEIPFKSKKHPDKWSNRLDGFLANSEMAFLVEAKSTASKSDLLRGICNDLLRIHSKELEVSFKKMSLHGDRQYVLPPVISGLIIAGYWVKTHSKPWFISESDFEMQLAHQLPEYTVTSKINPIGTYGIDGETWDFYVVVAQTTNLNWHRDTVR